MRAMHQDLAGGTLPSVLDEGPTPFRAPDAGRLRYRTPAGRRVVAAAVLASGMTGLDFTVTGIALPAIGRDLGVTIAGLQWVVDGYALTLTGLLLLGGALGDRYGRRRVFSFGIVWFAAASLLSAAAPSPTWLIAARALQGTGAALLMPGSLAILHASFVPEDRSTVIGAWSGLSGVIAALGPFVGGWLISALSWRLVFLINLPVAGGVLMAVRHVPESHLATPPARLDIPGAGAVTAGLTTLTYAVIQGPTSGWSSASVLGGLLAGPVLLATFVIVELRARSPLLPLRWFASAQFSGANAVTFAVYAALGATLFLLPVVLQQVSGYSALVAGSALLPVTAIMLGLSTRSGRLTSITGPRVPVTIGPMVMAVGLIMLVRVDRHVHYTTELLPALVALGVGLAMLVAPLAATAVASAPVANAGMASAVNTNVGQVGGLLAVAVLPAVAGITDSAYRHPGALLHGFHLAVLLASIACAVAASLAAATLHHQRRTRSRVNMRTADDVIPVEPAGVLSSAGGLADVGPHRGPRPRHSQRPPLRPDRRHRHGVQPALRHGAGDTGWHAA